MSGLAAFVGKRSCGADVRTSLAGRRLLLQPCAHPCAGLGCRAADLGRFLAVTEARAAQSTRRLPASVRAGKVAQCAGSHCRPLKRARMAAGMALRSVFCARCASSWRVSVRFLCGTAAPFHPAPSMLQHLQTQPPPAVPPPPPHSLHHTYCRNTPGNSRSHSASVWPTAVTSVWSCACDSAPGSQALSSRRPPGAARSTSHASPAVRTTSSASPSQLLQLWLGGGSGAWPEGGALRSAAALGPAAPPAEPSTACARGRPAGHTHPTSPNHHAHQPRTLCVAWRGYRRRGYRRRGYRRRGYRRRGYRRRGHRRRGYRRRGYRRRGYRRRGYRRRAMPLPGLPAALTRARLGRCAPLVHLGPQVRRVPQSRARQRLHLLQWRAAAGRGSGARV